MKSKYNLFKNSTNFLITTRIFHKSQWSNDADDMNDIEIGNSIDRYLESCTENTT